MAVKISLLLAAAATLTSAQQPAWAQCGGIGWTGGTTCVSGYSCFQQNSYYYQCIPSTSSSSSGGGGGGGGGSTTTSATTSVSSTTTAPGSSATKYIISFGDSYSQTGFNPNGALPSRSNPIGNPNFPGSTTSGGINWLGYYITQFNHSLIYNYNYAYGGATTDSNIVKPYSTTVLSFVDQVKEYSQGVAKHPSNAPWTSDNTLFAIWMGINDVGQAYYLSNFNSLLQPTITQYFNQTQYLYNSGARKFLFLTIPPMYETPELISDGASAQNTYKTDLTAYNNLLLSNIATFASKNTGVQYWILNTTTPFQTAINNPQAYGAPDATCYDAGGVRCLWWNNVSI
jgi:hypothetical protein